MLRPTGPTSPSGHRWFPTSAGLFGLLAAAVSGLAAPGQPARGEFRHQVEPLLARYCYDCHGAGIAKGGVTLDEFAPDADVPGQPALWWAALKNLRAGLMPPREKGVPPPTPEEIQTIAGWIKYRAFGIDPQDPDPGRVTARRLNRIEYRNTIRDLLGYDFNSEVEFPPDDSGNGFDNNGDVLTLSPLLLEKYLAAAESIVDKVVPRVSRVMPERVATGREFRAASGPGTGEQLNARRALTVAKGFTVEQADRYQVVVELEARGSFDFDPSRCRLIGRIDGEERFSEEIAWSERRTLRHEYTVDWRPGRHEVSFEVVPLAAEGTAETAPAGATRPQNVPGPTSVTMRISSVTVRGPLSPEHWAAPENHARFFPRGPAPAEAVARERYATELLERFATRAFRRPAEPGRVAQLVEIARQVYAAPGRTFEEGIGRAMMAVLASPRFLFRVEPPAVAAGAGRFAPIDEFALASRLSYFLWSTMPDEELFRLARRGELRRQLPGQLRRMLADPRSQAFVRNFTGQWLQARDVEFVPINVRAAVGPDAPRTREGRVEFDSAFRKLMRAETERYFDYVLREDRSLLELVDSDYTFLNEQLARFYGVPGVAGDTLRLVQLPPDSPRGGVLTQGTVLAVTSNPTRTSPVKRGLFVLDNILGTPPPPAPPNVPELEESRKEFKGRDPKLSEILAVHRANPLCHSCHARMDPLGLALENFNALGGWRETDARQPIDPSGQLVTGEKFADVRELKRVLVRDRAADIFRCLTEKVFTYALGRAIEPHDAHTLEEITARLQREGGRFSVLLEEIVAAPAFQKQRVRPEAGALSLAAP